MVRSVLAAVLVVSMSACGGGGDAGTTSPPAANLPSDAAAMQTSTHVGMKTAISRMTAYEAGLMFTLHPGSTLTPNMTVAADLSPGAAPFSITFSGDVDSGYDQPSTIKAVGKATFASDPATTFSSVSGQAAIDVTVLGLLKVYHADIAFTIGPVERRVSGTGVLQNPGGNTSTMTI